MCLRPLVDITCAWDQDHLRHDLTPQKIVFDICVPLNVANVTLFWKNDDMIKHFVK